MIHLKDHEPANESIKPVTARTMASIQNDQLIDLLGNSLTQAIIDIPDTADYVTSKAENQSSNNLQRDPAVESGHDVKVRTDAHRLAHNLEVEAKVAILAIIGMQTILSGRQGLEGESAMPWQDQNSSEPPIQRATRSHALFEIAHTSQGHASPAYAKCRFTPEPLTYARFGSVDSARILGPTDFPQERTMFQNLPCFGVYPVYPYITRDFTLAGHPAQPDVEQDISPSLALPSPVVLRQHGESRSLHNATCATARTCRYCLSRFHRSNTFHISPTIIPPSTRAPQTQILQ